GRARITDDARLLAASAIKDRAPKIGIVVAVEEALLHCAKAVGRASLWDPSRHIDRSILPSYAQMLLEHVQGLTQEENERQSQIMTERGLSRRDVKSAHHVAPATTRSPSELSSAALGASRR